MEFDTRIMRHEVRLADLEKELHSARQDIDRLHAVVHAGDYADHCKAIDDMANEAAGMTAPERRYFERGGKAVPAVLMRFADWWARQRRQYGF